MKILPKQSVCPHCKTVYRYSDLKKIMWKKSDSCYHCKKNFRISRKSFWILALEMIIIYAIMNVIAIGLIESVNFISLFIMNVIPALEAVMLLPLYIEMKKEKKTKMHK